MAITCMPKYPFFLFGILEPGLLSWGYVAGWLDPFTFYKDQVPNNPVDDMPPQGLILTLMTVNLFGVMIMAGLMSCWSMHKDIAKKYTIIMIITDVGHTYSVWRGVGADYFWDPTQWNAHNILNIGMCMFLLVHRIIFMFDGFGPLLDEKDLAERDLAKKNA